MKKQMSKTNMILIWMISLIFFGSTSGFAKHDGGHGRPSDKGNPSGWTHGEKKGWHGESTPPGWNKDHGGDKSHKNHDDDDKGEKKDKEK